MREIKFRAWDTETKEMRLVRAEDLHSLEFKLSAKYGELMQYTGLKDKNGKEIYEGDIVRILYTDWASQTANEKGVYELSLEDYKKSISEIGYVEWVRDRWMMKFGKNRFGEFTWGTLQEGNHGEKEIIGNIYENPELLK